MFATTSSAGAAFAVLFAAVLMVAAGTAKKRLFTRVQVCPVCHHARTRCTCRWL
jgi:hypothetical protein